MFHWSNNNNLRVLRNEGTGDDVLEVKLNGQVRHGVTRIVPQSVAH